MRRKVISILQPVYLPWLGYFEQMAHADHFVFFDDVQYTRQDWRNRNRILTKGGPIWLTVPTSKKGLDTHINQVTIDNSKNWRQKHLRSISYNYQNAANFQPLYDLLKSALSKEWVRLLDLDIELTLMLSRCLGINTGTSLSSNAPPNLDPSEMPSDPGPNSAVVCRNMRIIELCQHHNATLLYEGAKGAQFIDVDLFQEHGIEVVFQNYQHPVYPQRFSGFHSHMSVIDLIMNTGTQAKDLLLSSPMPAALAATR